MKQMTAQRITTNKVQEHHTKLLAYIYVRQSSARQVRNNSGSADVQRSMYDHAVAYGFAPENIATIQSDQGRSGSSAEGREGFKAMLQDIVSGRVGAVFCSHSSRLARSGRDSQHLLACCEIAGTLIVDQNGVYDPRNDNDRFFLGIKGVFDEVDLQRIKTMMMEAKVALARKGRYRMRLPPGYVWDCVGKTEDGQEQWAIKIDPDRRVQQAIRSAFDLLEQLGSALAVTRHLNATGEKFPSCNVARGKDKYVWRSVEVQHLVKIFRNPVYAGSYVYGKSTTHRDIQMGDSPQIKFRRVRLDPQDWKVNIRGNHEGYITWEQYERNVRQIDNNAFNFKKGCNGAVRSGRALLQGIVRCGKCRRAMQVIYPKGAKFYSYACNHNHCQYGSKVCCTIPGLQVDKVIEDQLIQAFASAQLDLSLEAVRQAEARAHEALRRSELNIRAAQEAAEYSDYRYMQVDPKNIEVKALREADLQDKLLEVKKLKDKHAALLRTSPRSLDSSEHEAILKLAKNIPKIWHSERMSNVTRKRLVRALIEKVELIREGNNVDTATHWRTGAKTHHCLTVRKVGNHTRNDPRVFERVRELVSNHTDQEIAEILNEEGLRSKFSNHFTKTAVKEFRRYHKIQTLHFDRCNGRKGTIERRGDGRYSIPGAARLLSVPRETVRMWCKKGLLDAVPPKRPKSSWWINLSEEEIEQKLPRGLIKNIEEAGKRCLLDRGLSLTRTKQVALNRGA
jgi:DNA invertase Pin-like site-specific DNA recombinase